MLMLSRIISLAASLVCGIWAFGAPGFDSFSSLAGSLAALASTFVKAKKRRRSSQTQNLSGGSIGVQAGRDVTIKDSVVRK